MADFIEEENQDEEEEQEEDCDGDGDYEYAYESEEDLLLPAMKREVSETHFEIPTGECAIYKYIEVAPLMEKLILEVSTLLGVSRIYSELLLRHTRWNHNLIAERYFGNEQKLLQEAGTIPENGETKNDNNQCLVCFDDISPGTGCSLVCGHICCRDCFCGYLENTIADGPSCMTMSCPSYKCPLKIASDTIKEFATDEVSQKFYMYLVRDFIDSSAYMYWCPSATCGKIAIGTDVDDIICACSFPYCSHCGLEAHRPATCKEVDEWQLKNVSESENSSWILVNTKGCPKCSRRIEKNQGCNHMTCSICRHEFCWICMGDWKSHNGTSYQCNQYTEDTQEMQEFRNVRQRLDRYLHYFSRYHNHDKSLKYALKLRDKFLLASANGSDPHPEISLDTLITAAKLLTDCRRVLKNSYIVGYYALNAGAGFNNLYEFQQQMLESNTEALSGLIEKESYLPEDREHITNLMTVTDKFLEYMLKYHHDVVANET